MCGPTQNRCASETFELLVSAHRIRVGEPRAGAAGGLEAAECGL